MRLPLLIQYLSIHLQGGLVIPAQWLLCSSVLLNTGVLCQSLCGLMKTLQILSYYVSSLTMTAIAYDRYRLVCHPSLRRVNVTLLVGLVWLLGVLFISQNVVTLRVSEYFSPDEGLITCRVVWLYQGIGIFFRKARALSLMITQYFIPLGLTAIFYGFVMQRIWTREQVGASSGAKRQQFDARKKQTIQMLIFVTALFAVSYLPIHIWHFTLFFTSLIPQKPGTCYSSTFYMISYWIGISSCAMNPFVYLYFKVEFQREAAQYWKLIRNCGKPAPVEVEESGLGASSQTDSTSTSKPDSNGRLSSKNEIQQKYNFQEIVTNV